MHEYKVIFEHNKPVIAMLQKGLNYNELIKLAKDGNKRSMKWLVVVGEDENDAIREADKIMHVFWDNYLGKNTA